VFFSQSKLNTIPNLNQEPLFGYIVPLWYIMTFGHSFIRLKFVDGKPLVL